MDEQLLREVTASRMQCEQLRTMAEEVTEKNEQLFAHKIQFEGAIHAAKDAFELQKSKLDDLLQRKEALFNKLQLALGENRRLKARQKGPALPATKSTGLLTNISGFFNKLQVAEAPRRRRKEAHAALLREMAEADSYTVVNPEFDTLDFNAHHHAQQAAFISPSFTEGKFRNTSPAAESAYPTAEQESNVSKNIIMEDADEDFLAKIRKNLNLTDE